MDPELQELVDRIGTDNPPSDEELAQAREQLAGQLREAVETDQPDIEAGRSLRQAIDAVDAELDRREQQSRQEQEEARQLLEGLDRDDDEDDDDSEDEPTDDSPEDEGGDADESEADDEPAEPVAASNARKRRRGRSSRFARGGRDAPRINVLLAGPALGADEPATLQDAASVFHRHAHQVSRGKQPLVELAYQYPTERALSASATQNTALIDNYLSPRALAAAGGVCEPVPANFEHPICGDRGRPIRNAVPSFGADRGGVRFAPSATLNDLQTLGDAEDESAVGVWTHATDQTPGTDTKPCPRIDCEDETEVFVDAVHACLTVGNFQARFNPEFWQSRLDLLMVLHDRIAEQTLFTTMRNAATNVSVDASTDRARTILSRIDRAAAGIRSRHRLENTVLRFAAPQWLRDFLRSEIAQDVPGDGLDSFAVADNIITNFFAARNIDPVWSLDLQVFAAQAANGLNDWPDDEIQTLLYPEGTFFFMDGGTMDLGTEIQDSTLNQTNDRQAFMETFEQVAFRGCEAVALDFALTETT